MFRNYFDVFAVDVFAVEKNNQHCAIALLPCDDTFSCNPWHLLGVHSWHPFMYGSNKNGALASTACARQWFARRHISSSVVLDALEARTTLWYDDATLW